MAFKITDAEGHGEGAGDEATTKRQAADNKSSPNKFNPRDGSAIKSCKDLNSAPEFRQPEAENSIRVLAGPRFAGHAPTHQSALPTKTTRQTKSFPSTKIRKE